MQGGEEEERGQVEGPDDVCKQASRSAPGQEGQVEELRPAAHRRGAWLDDESSRGRGPVRSREGWVDARHSLGSLLSLAVSLGAVVVGSCMLAQIVDRAFDLLRRREERLRLDQPQRPLILFTNCYFVRRLLGATCEVSPRSRQAV